MLHRVRREQDGAVALMVAVTLIVLIGMLVLTVDLGRLWTARRKLSTGADAAALAAAQQCAFGNGSAAARSAGSASGNANESAAYTFAIDPSCDVLTSAGQKFVTVTGNESIDMIFAPIFGVSSSSVTAQATATWETPGTVPISVNAVPLEACKTEIEQGQTQCTFEYSSDQFQEPRWGILNLGLWNQPHASCPSLSASYTNDIIASGGIWPLPKPVPAYDCLDSSGNQASTWMGLEGNTYWFPVVDIPNSVLANGSLVKDDPGCTQGPDCRIVSAYVIDFVKMKVITVLPGNPEVLTVELLTSRGSVAGVEVRLVK